MYLLVHARMGMYQWTLFEIEIPYNEMKEVKQWKEISQTFPKLMIL